MQLAILRDTGVFRDGDWHGRYLEIKGWIEIQWLDT